MKTAREIYDKLVVFLSVEKSDGTEARTFSDRDGLWALRWNPLGHVRPTFEQFRKAYRGHLSDA